MNTNEIIEYFRGQNKPYEHCEPRMLQSTFSNTLRAIEAGTCKPKTMRLFFAKFGYKQNEIEWKLK